MSEFQASNFTKENGGTPDLLGKTELTSPYFFVPPSGDTASRPQSCAAGTLRFNTDIGTLEVYRGDTIGWEQIIKRESQYLGGGTGSNITGTGARGIFSGGYLNGSNDQLGIDFITISTLGNSQDFGDMSVARRGMGGAGSSVRGIFAGGDASPGHPSNMMGHITIPTLGNETDFGNLTVGREGNRCLSNSTRHINVAGYTAPTNSDVIDYISIQGLGNAVDFGDTTVARSAAGCFASSTRGIIAVGENTGSTNSIEFITIQTTGNGVDFGDNNNGYITSPSSGGSNATRGFIIGGHSPSPNPSKVDHISFVTTATLGNAVDFGNLTVTRSSAAAVSSPTRVVNGGGQNPQSINPIDYFEISTTGNALDFGDLSYARFSHGSTSNAHGGL